VAFLVDDAAGIYDKAVARGAKAISAPETLKDESGSVIVATVQTYGDTNHTFVQRVDYTGPFLPGFKAHPYKEVYNDIMPIPKLDFIDHVVGNQPDLEMEPAASWYEKMLDFHRFWSVDDTMMHTEYSALRSIVVCDFDEKVKMPINEPAPGKRKSQI
jgi:4-hydroxyphenylpyruvate dioxygenase